MYIKNKAVSAVWKVIIFISAVVGILLQCGVLGEKLDFSVLNYFTLMSNLLCAVYYLPAAIYTCKKNYTLMTTLKGSLLMCIIVTGMVYHFMLAGKFEMQGTLWLSNTLLHYVVPIMTFFDWILFDEKGKFKKYSPLLWIILPVLYFIYVNIRVEAGGILGPYGNKYPYYFMDIDALGIGKVLIINLVMLLFFILLGYIIVFLDSLFVKFNTSHRKSNV